MINIVNKADCCGCNACVQACPVQCITMREDKEGFLYPYVDNEKCINCNRCETVCPVINQAEAREPVTCYAAKNPDEEIRMKSSSGGIFTMLAEKVIEKGGVVFGARFDENWNVVHDYTESLAGIGLFRGSKYVQSRIGDCFRKAKQFLDDDREVLFSGTPCQVAGLKRFLRKDYTNLLAVDIICHGVPSPMLWRRYLKEMNPENLSLSAVSFRDKSTGWKHFSFHAKGIQEGDECSIQKGTLFEDTYLRLFLNNICLRPSCHKCPSRSGKGNSDVTIADFWGIDGVDPEFDDNKGISLVLPYSAKGYEAVNSLALDKKEKSIAVDPRCNPNLHKDCLIPKYRRYFFKKLKGNRVSLHKLLAAVEKPSRLRVLAWKIKETIKRILK